MSSLEIQVTLAGVGEVDALLHEMRNQLTDRRGMHRQMAVYGQKITQDYLRTDPRHGSAKRLGAKATGFRKAAARVVEAQSDSQEARVVIPRNTGLGRAFGDVVIRPGSGRTYLAIPGHQKTYGKTVRDFPKDTFRFAVIESFITFLALVFREDGGGAKKGEVGFWLRREVKQKQDRTLLPSDEEYAAAARGGAVDYLTEELRTA